MPNAIPATLALMLLATAARAEETSASKCVVETKSYASIRMDGSFVHDSILPILPEGWTFLCASGHDITVDGSLNHDEEPLQLHSWHLITITYGGTVSLVKDLTQRECEEIRTRIMSLRADSRELCKNGCPIELGSIKSVECFE